METVLDVKSVELEIYTRTAHGSDGKTVEVIGVSITRSGAEFNLEFLPEQWAEFVQIIKDNEHIAEE